MSRRKPCRTCGAHSHYSNGQCYECADAERTEEERKFNERSDVFALNLVEDLDELKDWIKDYLIK